MTPIDMIADLLEREYQALRHSDFAALRALADEKEQLVVRLQMPSEGDREALDGLRSKARRNDRLLAAVEKGLESARVSLKRLREPAAALDTYTQRGERTRIGATPSALTRRA
ncbi:hypothetical protein JMK10_14835 [Rhodovulum sulfidophilum]|uniref:hypothetical protein n=1 Tax=Rhodovulum sulfidophilum TaxID=35806 RepID=UPI0019235F08|nr:hypothetical protein [Rhodovulum sulfidophilum]MBL3572968.1 hypothetical protein [Rhodovulum sulfidophilum]MCE8430383.1 hypothetical protein [Rhodovulum sulfidophilum]MCF4118056.1 hypothetical protein [Rhodovulum sulfidophilum]